MAYLTKTTAQMLQSALTKLQKNTSINNVAPGSVARALLEMVTTELGDFYSIMEFNTKQGLLATATGNSLDLIGSLYNVRRKTLSDAAAFAAALGLFYFYINQPWNNTVIIPNGTKIYTDVNTYVGQQFSYQVVGDTYILPGHTRAWATIQPNFTSGVFSAGPNTLTVIDPSFIQPINVTVYCTNPKTIPSQTTQESDDAFRARIIAAVNTNAGGTINAMRLNALTVTGVRDVAIREAVYGLGTVEALIVTNDNLPVNSILGTVTSVLQAVKPAGVRLYVSQPNLLPIDLNVALVLRQNVPGLNVTTTIQNTTNAIINFLNTPLVGQPLVWYQLIQTILDATDYTNDVIINDFVVNGVETLRQNYVPADNEQLVPGSINVSIASTS